MNKEQIGKHLNLSFVLCKRKLLSLIVFVNPFNNRLDRALYPRVSLTRRNQSRRLHSILSQIRMVSLGKINGHNFITSAVEKLCCRMIFD